MNKLVFTYGLLISFAASAQFTYISPVPGSSYHNPETNIILKVKDPVDATTLLPGTVSVSGSLSGEHTCKIILADDQKTILLNPVNRFSENETVSVIVHQGFRKKSGGTIQDTSFQFSTHCKRTQHQLDQIKHALRQVNEEEFGFDPQEATLRNDSCLGFPSYAITVNDSDAFRGDVFYYNYLFAILPINSWYRTILSNNGDDTIFADCNNHIGIGWTINYDGHLTAFNSSDSIACFSVYDSSYNLVSNYYGGNGYDVDAHEFKLYPGGHAFLSCDDVQFVDMTPYGSIYDSAMVIGMILQEIDANQNVVFQWRSWDHFQIDDAVFNYSLLTETVDPVHLNSIELDSDQNILILCRHMNEITKINRSTGEIIWRWGGENNMFTFLNDDPLTFSQPHDIRRLSNGNYSMFNNAISISVLRSSAKTYHLDQVNHIATLVWKYEHPDVNNQHLKSSGLGSVQLLPNGNYFICWGHLLTILAPFPNFTEVDTAGNIHWEMRLTGTEGYYSYRAFKFDWNPNSISAIENINSTEKPLEIFPNPVFDHWTVRYASEDNSLVRLKVTDLLGSLIGEEVFRAVKGENSFSPATRFPSSGMYLVTVYDKQAIITRKILVSN